VVRGAAIACAIRGTGVSPSSFEFHSGFGRSVERVSPGPLYIWKRDQWWFFTLLLASRLGFRKPKGIAREIKPRTCPLRRHLLRLGMADRVTLVPPRDLWPFSTVTVDDLEALVADGLLRPLSGDPQPEWMAPLSGVAPSPPSGYVLSFVSFHERGIRVPASRFMRAILHFYGVELHNLSPNSIAQAAIFAAVCEGFLGIDPHWDLWTHLFSTEPFALTTRERRVRMAVRAGGYILQLRQARAQQYIPAILVSSNKGWQRRWFYLRNDDRRLPSFSQRVVTAARSNWRYGAPRDRQKNLQPLLEALQEL
jgi:hypothetical protein